MELWCCTNQPLHCDDNEKCEKWRDSLDADRRINLANPSAERGVRGMRRGMVSMDRLYRL